MTFQNLMSYIDAVIEDSELLKGDNKKEGDGKKRRYQKIEGA